MPSGTQHTWTGNSDNVWANGDNWLSGSAPGGFGWWVLFDTPNPLLLTTTAANLSNGFIIGLDNAGVVTLDTGSGLPAGGVQIARNAGSSGTLNVGTGGNLFTTMTAAIYGGLGDATLNLNYSSNMAVNGTLTGTLTVNLDGSGTTTFGGVATSKSYNGSTNVNNGTLILGANLTGANNAVTVNSGGTLRSNVSRTINGRVTVASGGTLQISNPANNTPATMTIGGNLSLNGTLDFKLGLDGGNPVGDLLVVNGEVTLGGTLNIIDIGDFGDGTYMLINLAGSSLGASGSFSAINAPSSGNIDITDDGVFLVIGAVTLDESWWAPGLSFGGDGVWDNDTANWTNDSADFAAAWGESLAIFTGEAGTVTVAEDVLFGGIRFDADGYRLEGPGLLVTNPDVLDGNDAPRIAVAPDVTATVDVLIQGSRGLRKDGDGELVLTRNQTYTGTTAVAGGRLTLGEGGSTGMVPGAVALTGGGQLAINRSDTVTLGAQNLVSGNGRLYQIGSGTTIITANHTYSGQTHIEGGTLQLGGTAGGGTSNTGGLAAGMIVIGDAGTLAFNRGNGTFDLGNNISGTGRIVQRSATGSTVNLTGNLGDFAGELVVQSGQLNVTGASFGGSLDVASTLTLTNTTVGGVVDIRDGGTLRGSGTLGGLTVHSGGTLSPGNSFGTISVDGNLVLASGSSYLVNVNAAGDTDLLYVTGSATLDGSNLLVIEADDARGLWRASTPYTILMAEGGVSGSFEAPVNNLVFLTPSLEYGDFAVTLVLERNDIRFGELPGLNVNQVATGDALEGLAGVNIAHPVVTALLNVSQGAAPGALSGLSGQYHADLRGMLLDDSRLVRDTVMARASHAAGRATGNQLWVRALAHDGHAGDGVSRFERHTAGFLVGADHELGAAQASLGWAAGHHRSSASVSGLDSGGDINSSHVAVYGGARWDAPFQVSGLGDTSLGARLGAAWSWHEVDTHRRVSLPGFSESMGAQYDANTLQAFAEADWRMVLDDTAGRAPIELAPFLGLAWVQVRGDSFVEGDQTTDVTGTAVLRAPSQSHDASFATLGVRGSMPWPPPFRDASLNERMTLSGMLGYRRALSGHDLDMRMAFLDDSDGGFSVAGAPIARNAFIADLGLDVLLGRHTSLGVAWVGQISSDVRDHALRASLQITLP